MSRHTRLSLSASLEPRQGRGGLFHNSKVFFRFGMPVKECMLERTSVFLPVQQPPGGWVPLAGCPPPPLFLPGTWFFHLFWQSPPLHPPFRHFISCRRNELSFVTITSDDMHMFCEHPQAKGSNNENRLVKKKNNYRKCDTGSTPLLENNAKKTKMQPCCCREKQWRKRQAPGQSCSAKA